MIRAVIFALATASTLVAAAQTSPCKPPTAEDYYQQGKSASEKKEYDAAIAAFEKAIRLDPKMAKAWHCRGASHVSKDECDKAVSDFTEAIRLDPKMALAWYDRGTAYLVKHEYDKAIADLSESIRLDPNTCGRAIRPKRTRILHEPKN